MPNIPYVAKISPANGIISFNVSNACAAIVDFSNFRSSANSFRKVLSSLDIGFPDLS